jgi:hypothetical protein
LLLFVFCASAGVAIASAQTTLSVVTIMREASLNMCDLLNFCVVVAKRVDNRPAFAVVVPITTLVLAPSRFVAEVGPFEEYPPYNIDATNPLIGSHPTSTHPPASS